MNRDEKSDLYVDKNLNSLSLKEWSELFEDFSYRLIGRTHVCEFTINTVWTGIGCMGSQPFETGIFNEAGDLIREERHSSEKEAREYHLMMVMGYMNQGFLNFLEKELICNQSPAPTAE